MLDSDDYSNGVSRITRHELLSVSKAPPLKLVSALQAVFEVTTLDDVINASDGELSLREAIDAANTSAGANTITFANKIQGGTIELVKNLPSIEEDLLIDGNTRSGVGDGGSDSITIDGNLRAYNAPGGGYTYSGAETVLVSSGFANLTLNNLTITGGKVGIENDGNDLALSDVVVTDNSQVVAFEGPGGVGIRNTDGGNLFLEHSFVTNNIGTEAAGIVLEDSYARLVNSTIADNQGSSYDYVGSGIKGFGDLRVYESTIANNGWANAVDITGNFALINSTVAGNSDGVFVSGTGEITNSTIADNGGSGVYALQIVNDSGAFFISNSIIAGEVYGSFISNGANIFTSNEPPIESAIPGDVLGADMRLLFQTGSLADNGGPTETIALLDSATNPALDAADPADAPETDQRGLPRDATPDIGAFEADGVPFDFGLVITTLDDVILSDGKVSLREAITTANVTAGADTITFADNLRGQTANLDLAQGSLRITEDLVIDGDPLDGGRDGIVIDASTTSSNDLPYGARGGSIIEIGGTSSLRLEDLTLTNWYGFDTGIAGRNGSVSLYRSELSNGFGPDLVSSQGINADLVRLVESTIANFHGESVNAVRGRSVEIINSTIQTIGGTYGAGISGRDVRIAGSTVTGISIDESGQAISGVDSLEIINSTLVNNRVEDLFYGRAAINGADVRLINSTVVGNGPFDKDFGADSPGISGGYLYIANSIVMDNGGIGQPNIVGPFFSNGANIFSEPVDGARSTDVIDATVEQVLVTSLGPDDEPRALLANNGGSTSTVALLDSPDNSALDAADPADAPATDQRGYLRDATPDIGSFELDGTPVVVPDMLPLLAEKVPLPDSEIVGAPLFLVGPSGDAEVSFVDEYAAFQSSLGVYLVSPDGTIGATEWVFDWIEHSEASDDASANARPGGGPMAPGEAVLLSDLFAPEELTPGTGFGLFLAADGWALNDAAIFTGGHLEFRSSGGPASVTDMTPELVFITDNGHERLVLGDILHTIDAGSANPLSNKLNPGDTGQVTSGLLDGAFTLAFEDKLLSQNSDRDFNDALFAVEPVNTTPPIVAQASEATSAANVAIELQGLVTEADAATG